MALTIGQLAVELIGDTKKLERDLKKIEVGVKGMGQALAAVTAVGVGLGFVGKKVFDLGSSVAEIESKFNTVFGNASADVSKFIDDFATMAGLSKSTAQELTATTGAIAQGMGFAQDASAQFAIEITKVAGDLSSFNDVPTAQTLNAITNALTGERQELKRLGIVILEADVQQKALNNTGKENAKLLTQQEKATATLQLITERAGVAMGDLARTQDSAANQAKQLGAEFRNIAEGFSTQMLPVLTQLLPLFRDLATAAEGFALKAADFFTTLLDLMGLTDPVVRANVDSFNKLNDARKELLATQIRGEIVTKRETIARKEHIKALIVDIGRQRRLTREIKALTEEADSLVIALDIMDTALARIDRTAKQAAEALRETKAAQQELRSEALLDIPDIVAIGGDAGIRLPEIPPPRIMDPFADAMERASVALGDMRPILDDLSRTIVDLVLGFKTIGDVVKRVGVAILDSIVGALVEAIAKAIVFKGIFGAFGLPIPFFGKGGILSAQGGLSLPGGGRGGIPIIAHPGEAILNKSAVQALGGGAAIDAINKMGAGAGMTINADFSQIPQPMTPREAALSAEFQTLIREVILQIQQGGFRLD